MQSWSAFHRFLHQTVYLVFSACPCSKCLTIPAQSVLCWMAYRTREILVPSFALQTGLASATLFAATIVQTILIQKLCNLPWAALQGCGWIIPTFLNL